MTHYIHHWIIAAIIAVCFHISLFYVFKPQPKVLIERSRGPIIEILGAEFFAKLEKEQKNSVDSQKSENEDIKPKENPQKVEDPAKSEPEKKISPPKSEPKTIEEPIEKASNTDLRPSEFKGLLKQQDNKHDNKPIKKEPEVKKEVKKAEVKPERKPEPKKKIEKQVKKVKPKPKPKKLSKKKKKKSIDSRKAGQRTLARQKGGGGRGRQKKLAGSSELTNYLGRLNSHLARYKRFPRELNEQGIRGVVKLRVSINSSGQVYAVKVSRSSGNKQLDQAGINTVKRANPFPPIPKGFSKKMTFTAPITYR